MENLNISRHLAFYSALAIGLITGVVTAVVQSELAVAVAANCFFLVYLVMTWRVLRKLTPEFLRKHGAEEDAPAPFILLVMLGVVIASAVSLILVLTGDPAREAPQLTLGVLSVLFGWFAVNTMWAMHYAFEYYDVPEASGEAGAIEGGLVFPGEDEPNGVAFLYFAYTIGMTAQTSDINIASNSMRRLVFVHGVFSFFFNTVLVASAVNIVVALAR